MQLRAESGRATARSIGGSGISDQTTAATRRTVGHHGGLGAHGESKAVKEMVPVRWRQGTRGGAGLGEAEAGVVLRSRKGFLGMVGSKGVARVKAFEPSLN